MSRLYAWSWCIKYLVDSPVEGRLVLEVQSPRNGLRSDLHHVHDWRCGGVTTSQDGWDTERNKDGAYGRRAVFTRRGVACGTDKTGMLALQHT